MAGLGNFGGAKDLRGVGTVLRSGGGLRGKRARPT